MSKRSINEMCDSINDCSSIKRQSVDYPIKPFGCHRVSSDFICSVSPITIDSNCERQEENERPPSPELHLMEYPPSPLWLEPEDLGMDFYPDHYPPSPISSDGHQYGSDLDDESVFDDIHFGSNIGSDNGLIGISDNEPDFQGI